MNTTTEKPLIYTALRITPTYGKGRRILVTARTSDGYFSVTAEIGKPGARDCDMCGCLHAEIMKYFPKLKPLVDLHLSDSETGIPMHAKANGWYWAAKASGVKQQYKPEQSPEKCLSILAEHLRISEDEARALCSPELTQEAFCAAVDAMLPRWADEAGAGRELIEALNGNN